MGAAPRGVARSSLNSVSGRRPPVVAVCEDPFSLRGSSRAMRAHGARLKPRRQPPVKVDMLSRGTRAPRPSIGAAGGVACNRTHRRHQGRLPRLELRERLVILGRRLRDGGDARRPRAVSTALTFLRRVGSLPLGLEVARRTANVLFDADDDVDSGVRAMFRPSMALAPLAEIGEFFARRRSLRGKRLRSLGRMSTPGAPRRRSRRSWPSCFPKRTGTLHGR